MTEQIFHDHEADRGHSVKWWMGRVAIYSVLIFWTVICLFPIYWTITTSFKIAPNVMQGHLVPFVAGSPCACINTTAAPAAATVAAMSVS